MSRVVKGKDNAEHMFRVVDDDIESPYKDVTDIQSDLVYLDLVNTDDSQSEHIFLGTDPF